MWKALVFGLIAAAVVTPALAKDITIRNNGGGQVVAYMMKANDIRNSGGHVKFAGRCDSACTMLLSVKNACVTPSASFGFHLAFGAGPKNNALATKYLMQSYPGWVRNWIASKGGLTSGIKRMNFAYASKYIPICGN